YEETVDRESAYEILQKAAAERAEAAQKAKEEIESMKADKAEARASRGRDTATDRFVKNVAGSLGTTIARSVGNALVRGILGGLTKR
ncbi:MAG: helicase HerA-like domain-containing protein, partial [Hyphomicrobiales bacterium]